VTQTTQAGREAKFKAITQKHNSRPLLMQGHHRTVKQGDEIQAAAEAETGE